MNVNDFCNEKRIKLKSKLENRFYIIHGGDY